MYGNVGLILRPDGVPADILSETQVISGFALDVSVQPRISRPVVSNTDALPINDESVKLLVLHHVHELIADRKALLAEACRVLAPGGRLVLVCLNPLGRSLRWKPVPDWILHWRSARQLVTELASMGLQKCTIDGVFAAEGKVSELAGRAGQGLLAPVARLAADGYVLTVRKPSETGRIVNARSLISKANNRVGKAAHPAGMSRSADAGR
ncbi:MAG: class I SAM-dependent methyltransferase [Xanthomonadales bacterium]|nr:class I SAM-dependent methyltransferase [Xanthomonadales bacterium]